MAAFVPYLRTGNLIFLSGHITKIDGNPWVGQLGVDVTTAQGKKAARALAIDLLGTLLAEVFDEKGMQARSAFGVAQVPFGSCVEIELIAEVDE